MVGSCWQVSAAQRLRRVVFEDGRQRAGIQVLRMLQLLGQVSASLPGREREITAVVQSRRVGDGQQRRELFFDRHPGQVEVERFSAARTLGTSAP